MTAIDPAIVIAVRKNAQPHFPSKDTPIKYRRKQCRRADNESFRNYAHPIVIQLEGLIENAQMSEFICPHRGVNLASVPQKKGCVICPAHGLAWQIKTGKLVKLPTF